MAIVDLNIENRIATITFNRPDALNALSMETIQSFQNIVSNVTSRKEVSVIILTGAGDKSFIAGADIKEMSSMTPKEAFEFSKKGQAVLFDLERASQITIAAVNGFALGGGCEFAMACDLIYASDNAKFGQPEVSLGITAGFGGTQRLPRLVGAMKAREMLLLGHVISASDALTIGLVAKVFPKADFMIEISKIANALTKNGPEALIKTKQLIREGVDLSLKGACELEQKLFSDCFGLANQKEGMKAFIEKRKPNWETT
ncbi:MAG: enoyl-CoA hydratase/isomerase family protein [Bdellovibrionales bacterium]|nr:enoyl-CoA hydratase/isomerase family protein [Bdellovibrionales bacterium]